jgi:hypothetical protein
VRRAAHRARTSTAATCGNSSKSRSYTTTLGELRATRAAYRARQDELNEDENGGEEDENGGEDDATVVLSIWEYLGSGYLNPGDVLLAAGVDGSLRVAREALLDLRCGPP